MIKTLSFTLACCTALSLAGCVSIDEKPTKKVAVQVIDVHGLPAQELAAGSCGIFFWSQTSPKHFVFFQEEGAQSAQLFYNDSAQSLASQQVTTGLDG